MEEPAAVSAEPRAKRQKRDTPGKSAAFEKLKQLKGSKHKYEVSDVDHVYEVVDEKEYTKRVLTRQDDDWIVDDDGSGYVEDGRDIFDDDLDAESIAAAATSKGTKKKKKAVSEQAGKGNLQYMLSNLPSKKRKEQDTKLDEDNILSELISELDEGNNSTQTPQRATIKPKPMSNFSLSADKKAAKDYMNSFSLVKSRKSLANNFNSQPKPKKQCLNEKPSEKILKEIQTNHVEGEESLDLDSVEDRVVASTSKIHTSNEEYETGNCENMDNSKTAEFHSDEDLLDDDFDITQIEEFSIQESEDQKEDINITEEQLLSGWETMQQGTSNDVLPITVNISHIPMVTNDEGKQVFRFFWWDAHEASRARPGQILLFGKTWCESVKSYISCSVLVQNIDRKIYLLPRTHCKVADSESVNKPVALIDVYKEFNTVYAPQLYLQSFKSRKVNKNYCFDPMVPVNSEYLEIKYHAKYNRLDYGPCISGGNTFSKVFGNSSSFLELFLLDRKIKGPCWLDISLPEPVNNPLSYCKLEVSCTNPSNVNVVQGKNIPPPPPLLIAAINIRTAINPKNMTNEIVMISVLVHSKYVVDKKPPNPMFEQHFCVFSRLGDQTLPFDFHESLQNFKGTKVIKTDSERALLNLFTVQIARIDPDLIVGHDLLDYQISLLTTRLLTRQTNNISKLGRVKRSEVPPRRALEQELFLGRLVCDIKLSAKELIKSRSFDLDALCQTVLKMKEGERIEIEIEEVPKFFETSSDILKLISYTMQDAAYILKMMYELNVIPLALQITNIAGNVMSKTLLGGRSERNEFLLLHAFSEKDYIVPEKKFVKRNEFDELPKDSTGGKKKPMYSGGLVLDPEVGFYDKLILLMDFNSLYPSIIQEYNICFTTIPATSDEQIVLPDSSLPPGILPTEIRKLVESRRAVKQLMNNPDLSPELRMQYNIRQMALKLTANSMYGCLGFTNSRFYAVHLAALITQKGRDILTSTKNLMQKLNYQVIYGDTDSLMINTSCLDYDEVMKIGNKIKQEVNKLYRQVELDIDGVFKYLLLLKKKKYASVILTKDKTGKLIEQKEYKGLDIVRRDWSQLAATAGRVTLENILSDQSQEDRINNIHMHLEKLKVDLEENKVPLSLLVITKQLSKDPKLYADKNQLPHVQVALRYNKKGGRILKAGDTVPYVVCDDGTNSSATQRAYHIEELKNSETLKIDTKYYLAQQIHPVVSRLCEPLDGTDSYQIANCLGLDGADFRRPVEKNKVPIVQNAKEKPNRFLNCDPFTFNCITCSTMNKITSPVTDRVPFLMKCANPECHTYPVENLPYLEHQLIFQIRDFIKKYYRYKLTCENPVCPVQSSRVPFRFSGKRPVCSYCKINVLQQNYTAYDLYNQLLYFQSIFDISKLENQITDVTVENAFYSLQRIVKKTLQRSKFAVINLTELFAPYVMQPEDSKSNDTVENHKELAVPLQQIHFQREFYDANKECDSDS